MTAEQTAVRRAVGAVLGGQAGACDCQVCGPKSPFAASSATLGPGFVDYDLVDASQTAICDGCRRLLAGKPGSDPPPLRTHHWAVVSDELSRLDAAQLVELLRAPPVGVQAVAWAKSRQKHAVLRCGTCSPMLLRIGSDDGTIEWRPATDAALLDAISELRRGATRDQILAGDYPPHVLERLGAAWSDAEAVVARYRPSLQLDMAAALVPRPEITATTEVPPMLLPDEVQALSHLLYALTRHSAWRQRDAIRFWSELLPRRLEAASTSASLAEWVSYLLGALDVAASHPEVVEAIGADLGPDAELLPAIRRDHRLLVVATRQIYHEQRLED